MKEIMGKNYVRSYAHVIDLKIAWVSNYRYPITKSSNRTPVIEHPRDHTPITWQIGTREPITIKNFVKDMINGARLAEGDWNFV